MQYYTVTQRIYKRATGLIHVKKYNLPHTKVLAHTKCCHATKKRGRQFGNVKEKKEEKKYIYIYEKGG
jgi:hypothetical protein